MSTWVLIYILTSSDGITTNKVEGISSQGACMTMGNDIRRQAKSHAGLVWSSFSCSSKG